MQMHPPCMFVQVPVIAILGSGGGFRAMVGFAGVMKALYESGIFDCATYIAGLSGSTWYVYFFKPSHLTGLKINTYQTQNRYVYINKKPHIYDVRSF